MPYHATAIVNGGEDYRREALDGFSHRLEMLRALVRHLNDAPTALDALLLPAGFFCARSEARVSSLATEVVAVLVQEQPGFAVIWGIDGWVDGGKTELRRAPEGYPFFVYALRKGQHKPILFRQLSITAAEGDRADAMWDGRAVCCDSRLGLLICSECWSDALLRRVESEQPSVLFVPAHRNVNMRRDREGMGRMSWHLRLNAFSARTGIAVILAEHSRSPWRHDYAWGAKSIQTLDLPNALPNLFTVKLVEV